MAYHFKDKKEPSYLIPGVMSIWVFLIAISRLIIGVHDLQDVIGGLLIGIVFLIAFIYLEPTISEKIGAMSIPLKIILAVIASVALFAIGTLIFPTTGLDLVPNAPSYTDAGAFAQVGGVILGLGIGFTLENEYVKYEPSELDTKQKIINLVIGLIILLAIFYGMEAFKSTFNSVIYRYIRYALVAFILTCLVPMLFKRLEKIKKPKQQVPSPQPRISRKEERKEKIMKILKVSNKIKLEMIRNALEMDQKSFDGEIFDWADEFGFTIDGDFIIINKDGVSDFINALDKKFLEWEKEKDKI